MIKISNRRYWLFALLVTATVSFCHLSVASMDSCWSNDAECLVHGTLYKSVNAEMSSEIGRDILPLDIDCATTSNDNSTLASISVTQPPDYLLKRFERALGLALNGCHKGLKWMTFGLEFIPNCDKIIKLTVEQFHADALYALECPDAIFMQLEILHFQHNEIATITVAALSNLSLLRELYFVSNTLRHVEGNSFDNLHFIERIHMENESLLAIKDALLFQSTNVADLRLIGLKYVTSSLFVNLPETLLNLTIARTTIGKASKGDDEATPGVHDVGTLYINNRRLLRNVTIIDCELSVFKLNDLHGSVLFLILKGNKLKEFEVIANGTNASSELKVLDLSDNRLNHLPSQLLQPYTFRHLEELNLRDNNLKKLPILMFLSSIPSITFIDLTSNKLEYLLETNAQLETTALYQVRIRIDGNPWNCKWLLDFAHAHPDKFRIFQYDKFLSQINVNGLACVPADTSYEKSSVMDYASNELKNWSVNTNNTYLNISTFTLIYGSPWGIRRNQRGEALIIVFMLPVGIAILFLLLYLWIYCQRVFHLSFYKKCPLFKRKRSLRANRFDVVRQVPPCSTTLTMNNNEGYELPLNGIASVCNCVPTTEDLTNTTPCMTNSKCRKTHHITYVPLPDEHAHQIYEEIIDNSENITEHDGDVLNQSTHDIHPIYDHLTFELLKINGINCDKNVFNTKENL